MKTVTLKIGARSEGSYPVALRIGDRLANAAIPASEVDGLIVVSDPGLWRGGVLGGEDPAAEPVGNNAHFAAWLHSLVFRGDLVPCWDEVWQAGGGESCRLVLDIEPAELRWLRWEQMGRAPIFPARVPHCSVVRGPFGEPAPQRLRDGAIRILVVVGSIERDPDVQAEQEVSALVDTFEVGAPEVELKVGERLTRSELQISIRQFKPDVLHFIGHGRLDGAGQPYLELYDKTIGQNIAWRQEDILSDLGGHAPALVVLNACHTIDATGRQAAWSISDLFIKGVRARAVVGNHASVRGEVAGKMAAAFYQAIIEGMDADLALTEARNHIDPLKKNDRARGWDWTLPYLRASVPPDRILDLARVVPHFSGLVDHCREFRKLEPFVDRVAERRNFLSWVQAEPRRVTSIVVVRGTESVGKTDLVRSCLRSAAKRGRLIKYVPLDPDHSQDFLGVLRLLCDGDPASLIGRPLPEAAMAPFYRTLNALLEGGEPPRREAPEPGDEPVEPRWDEDGEPRTLPRNGGLENQVPLLFDRFIEALGRVPAAAREQLARELEECGDPGADQARVDDRPFLVVIDQIAQGGINPSEFQSILTRYLLPPFAAARVKDVVLVLVVSDNVHDSLGLDKLARSPLTLHVPLFALQDLGQLAMEFYEKYPDIPDREGQRIIWQEMVRSVGTLWGFQRQEWRPRELRTCFELAFPRIAPGGRP